MNWHGLNWHSINRGPLVDGELRLRPWDDNRREPPSIGVELTALDGWQSLAFEVTVGGDDHDLVVRVSCLVFSLYLSLNNVVSNEYRHRSWERTQARAARLPGHDDGHAYAYQIATWSGHGRKTGFYISAELAHLSIWDGDHGWESRQTQKWPWDGIGWSFSLLWMDKLIGSTRLEVDEASVELVADQVVVMPEGKYPAQIKLTRERRARWWQRPFTRWEWNVEVGVEGGIPFPGKGENSYDCDDDGLWMTSFDAGHEKPWEFRWACDKFALRALESRAKRGGLNWTPNDGWPPNCTPHDQQRQTA